MFFCRKRLLINNPELIVADEPMVKLDTKCAKEVVKLSAQEVKSRSKAVIMSAHAELLGWCV